MTQAETIFCHHFALCFQAAVGDLPIQEVCYSPAIKNLMIRLADTCNRYC